MFKYLYWRFFKRWIRLQCDVCGFRPTTKRGQTTYLQYLLVTNLPYHEIHLK